VLRAHARSWGYLTRTWIISRFERPRDRDARRADDGRRRAPPSSSPGIARARERASDDAPLCAIRVARRDREDKKEIFLLLLLFMSSSSLDGGRAVATPPAPPPHTSSSSHGDGYRWRKYGQKSIKGAAHPRSYYRCTTIDCPARKKVETSMCGMIREVTYEKEHTHEKPMMMMMSSRSVAQTTTVGRARSTNTNTNTNTNTAMMRGREREHQGLSVNRGTTSASVSTGMTTTETSDASEDAKRRMMKETKRAHPARGKRKVAAYGKEESDDEDDDEDDIHNGTPSSAKQRKFPSSATKRKASRAATLAPVVTTPDIRREKRAKKTAAGTPDSVRTTTKSSATKTMPPASRSYKQRKDDAERRKKFAASQREFERNMERMRRIDRDQRRREKALLAAEKSLAMTVPLSPFLNRLEDVSRLFADAADGRDPYWDWPVAPTDAPEASMPSPAWLRDAADAADADADARRLLHHQAQHLYDDDINDDINDESTAARAAAAKRPPALSLADANPADWTLKSPLDYLKSPFESILTGTPLLSSLSKAVKTWCESPVHTAIGALSPLAGAWADHCAMPQAHRATPASRWMWWH
jgi:hypothetical protein